MDALVIKALAVALIAYTLTRKDCPFGICRKLRERFPNVKPLRCTYCAAIWCSFLVVSIPASFLMPLAIAGLAIFFISFFLML